MFARKFSSEGERRWPVFFLERTDRAERDDAFHTQRFHAVNVRPEIQLRRRKAVAAAVARQKRDLPPRQRPQNVVVRRAAEGRLGIDLLDGFKAWHGV